MTSGPLLAFREVCPLLSIHPNTGYALFHSGDFPIAVRHVGARLFCRRVDVEHYLYDRTGTPPPPPDDGRVPCPLCGRRFLKLGPHNRARHPELLAAHGGA